MTTPESIARTVQAVLDDWNEFCHETIMHMNHPPECRCDKWCRMRWAPWPWEKIATIKKAERG